MSAPAVETSADLETFGLILDGFAKGATVHIDMVREDLEAAQIKPSQYGALFAAAVRRKWLRETGRARRSTKGSRRGGWVAVYTKRAA